MWLDVTEYNPKDECPICHEDFGTEQAIYKTPCNHIFHNNCLNTYCEAYNGNVLCPMCRQDIEYSCMDIWAFKNKSLGDSKNPNNAPSFNSKHVSDIYYSQDGGKKRRKSKTRIKKTNKKRKYNKRKTYRRRK